jgi:CRP-like cAMP-binding protein
LAQRRRIIRSFRLSPRGGDTAKSIKVGVGTLLGGLALFTETTRPVTAAALEPSTVLCIPRPLFLKMPESVCAKSLPSAPMNPSAICSTSAP